MSNIFNQNGLEKLGNTFLEIDKLNHQIFFIWLHMLKKEEKQKELPPNLNMLKNETNRWKTYAKKLEKEMNQIQSFRKKTHLKNELIKSLELYNFNSTVYTTNQLTNRCRHR